LLELNALAAANPQEAERLADVALAVPTPLVAEFLMSHLERTKFTPPRAGEYARQAVMLLPPTRYDTIAPLIHSLAQAPAVQQLALAEGLAATSLIPGRSLPDDVTAWMRRTLVASFTLTDYMLVKRAVEASQNLVFPEKNEPLRKLILSSMASHQIRLSAHGLSFGRRCLHVGLLRARALGCVRQEAEWAPRELVAEHQGAPVRSVWPHNLQPHAHWSAGARSVR